MEKQKQEKEKPRYFILMASTADADDGWSLVCTKQTKADVEDHINDRSLYPDPTAWEFKVILGREIPVDFPAKIRLKG